MDLIKNKWNNFRVHRKLNQLWNDYKQVSHLQDDPQTFNKLNLFLDQTKTVLKNYIENHNNKDQIDGFITDGQEVLNKMLEFIHNYDEALEKNQNVKLINEILEKSLELAEFILREPKFRKQIENSSKLLNELLNLIEKVENQESRIIIIKFLVIITENTDSKLFFAQKEGFSKMLNLLVQGDENIQQVVSRALLHFMQTEKGEESNFLNSLQNNLNAQEKQEFVSIKGKIHKLASDLKKFTFSEIQRVFLSEKQPNNNNNMMTPPQKRKLSSEQNNENFSPNIPKNIQIQIPEPDAIFQTDLKILMMLQNDPALDSTNDEEQEAQQIQNNPNSQNPNQEQNSIKQLNNVKPEIEKIGQFLTDFTINEEQNKIINQFKKQPIKNQNLIEETKENYQIIEQNQISIKQNIDQGNQTYDQTQLQLEKDDQEVIKKFLILKGGLKAIFEKIEEASEEIQIDLMGTITKLLSNNDEQSKLEFKKLNGYILLEQLFNNQRDFENESNIIFISNLFEFLEIMIANSSDKEIYNLDAFQLLLRLISNSNQFEVVNKSLQFLIKLFQINWKNMIIARRLKVFQFLINTILKIHDVEIPYASSNNNNNQQQESFQYGLQFSKTTLICYQQSQQNQQVLIQSEINKEQSQFLLTQIKEIFIMYSQIEGFYSNEFELKVSSLILKMLQSNQITNEKQKQNEELKENQDNLQENNQNLNIFDFDVQKEEELLINFDDSSDELRIQQQQKQKYKLSTCCEFFLDLLFSILERKMHKRCVNIFSIDSNFEKVLQNFSQLFHHFILETNIQVFERKNNFLLEEQKGFYSNRLMILVHQFLSCNHKNQINSSELNFEKSKPNLFLQTIINRNFCKDVQAYIHQIFKKLSNTTSNFMLALQTQGRNPQFFSYNIKILTILKDHLMMEEDMMKDFLQKDGLILMSYLTLNYICSETNHENLFQACNIFIDIATNINNSEKILNSSLNQEIPLIYQDNFIVNEKKILKPRINSIIQLFFVLINKPGNLNDNFFIILDQVHKLLLNKENFKIIKNEPQFLIFILEFLTSQQSQVLPNNNNLYTSLLSLFDIYISQFSSEEIEICFDYLINSENLKKCAKENNQEIQFLVDTFSLFGVHMLLNTNQNILDKFIGQEYVMALFGFLEIGNYNVQEMTLKLIFVIYSLKHQSKKKDNFPKNKYFFKLLHKLIEQSSCQVNEGLCQTIYDLIFWTTEQIHIIFPSNSSVVSTILNRSEQGSLLLKKKQMIESQKDQMVNMNNNNAVNSNNAGEQKLAFQNVELIEILLQVMKTYKDKEGEDYKHQTLKLLKSQIDQQNAYKLLDQDNLLAWFYSYLQPFQPITNDLEAEMLAHHKQIYEILLVVIEYDLKLIDPKRKSKMCDHFKKFHQDIAFLIILIRKFLIKIIENPTFLRQEQQNIQMNYLKNFSALVQSIEEIVGINQQINILILQCINKLACQNDGKFRIYMKQLQLFDIRDTLLIDILKYKIDGDTLMQILEGISFESLSKLKQFRDTRAVASLIKNLIEHKNHQNLQIVTIKILRHDVAVHEEYQKYATKIIQTPKFIQYLYPNIYNKKSSIAKCLSSYKTEEQDQNSDDDQDEVEQQQPLQQQQQQQQQQLLENNNQNKEKDNYQLQQFNFSQGPTSTAQFLQEFHSVQMESERKQILLRINKELIAVEQENIQYQAKVVQKIQKRKQQLFEVFSNEKTNIYKKINEFEIIMNQKLIKSNEKFSNKHLKFIDQMERKLSEGEMLFAKMKENQ